MMHPRGKSIGIIDRQFEMLGRDAVDQRRRLVPIGDEQDRAIGLPARARDVGPRQMFEMPRRGGLDSGSEFAAIGHQYRLRRGIVLRLRQEVGGDPGGVVVPIGDDQDFRRARDHIDSDPAEDAPLGGGDIGVARPDDLVDSLDRSGSISERRHRLRAADPVNLVDPDQPGGGENQRVQDTVRRRHGHDQPLDPCHLGRDRVHQHR